jgi:hypothetical protein
MNVFYQIASASEYGREGFVIETQMADGSWAIPDWEERGLPELVGDFPTREAALDALLSV